MPRASPAAGPCGGHAAPASFRIRSPVGVVAFAAGTSSAASGRKAAARKPTYWQCVATSAGKWPTRWTMLINREFSSRRQAVEPAPGSCTAPCWVTDFGLAKVAGPGAENLTHTGDILGTLRYMPPEAFEGKSDARSDVYSLGLTLYELLAMRPAFDEKERNKLIKQVTSGEPTPLDRVKREIPRDLVTIVQKSIEKEPSRRYATAEELAADLQRYIDDEPILARRQTELERYVRWARHNPVDRRRGSGPDGRAGTGDHCVRHRGGPHGADGRGPNNWARRAGRTGEEDRREQ